MKKSKLTLLKSYNPLNSLSVPHFSIIMPTYNQSSFIRRAIQSVVDQVYSAWELIIINDGSTDNTEEIIGDYLMDPRILYIKNRKNGGLGFALNCGLDIARYEFIAYLPSDDFYYTNHLQLMISGFHKLKGCILLYSQAKSENIDSFEGKYLKNEVDSGIFKQYGLQLVQVAHCRTDDRWIERAEVVTDDLFLMFWEKLVSKGNVVFLNQTSCNWTIHPDQRHKKINEKHGGSISKYKQFYGVNDPIKIYVQRNKLVNEFDEYSGFRKPQIRSTDSLTILLVGDLGYNPERIYALEEHGHKLYGLWSQECGAWNNTGPLPFGHVENIPMENWETSIRQVEPDIIYAQLNHSAVNIAYKIIKAFDEIPFVWHFKEGPSVCLANGQWNKLIDLYTMADGKIFIAPEAKEWYSQFIPSLDSDSCLILDGDLGKSEYIQSREFQFAERKVDEIHTVVLGRMVGLDLNAISELSKRRIHLHAYSFISQELAKDIERIAPDHFHIHRFCPPRNWTCELSQYDAGWGHNLISNNEGSIQRATWDDLNIPSRLTAYAAAGLPIIQRENKGNLIAANNYLKKMNVGVFFTSYDELANKLFNRNYILDKRSNMLKCRQCFCFDYHVPTLIAFFKNIIAKKRVKLSGVQNL